MDLGIEDFKQLLFDLYLAQRENAVLRERLADFTGARDGQLLDKDGEAIA